MRKRLLFLILIIFITGCAQEVDVSQIGELKLTSSVFENNGNIPGKYTCQGDNINPPLSIGEIPENTKSLVLIMDDPDAPMGTWDHWIVFNIEPITEIVEDSVPGVQGKNSRGRNEYTGPCPPSGTHRYMFKLYALDANLDLDENIDKKGVEQAMEGHIIAQTKLIGLYSKG